MPKKKNVSVEMEAMEAIVRKPSAEDMRAMLDQMIRDRVDEALAARGSSEAEPGFHTREASNELRRHQVMFDRRKWALYFEKWGCQHCGKKNVGHGSNGHCRKCHTLISQRMAQIKREYDRANPDSQIAEDIDHLTRRLRSARELLGEGEE